LIGIGDGGGESLDPRRSRYKAASPIPSCGTC
jgi:hypothetical protein